MVFSSGTKLVFIGDSITDAGRSRPIGEGLFAALGNGYVAQVDALIQTGYAEKNIRIINVGGSGNTVVDLQNRWQTDVIDLKPNWLSVCIGINDVWRQFDSPLHIEAQVDLDTYQYTLEQLIREVHPSLDGLVLMTPFVIEPNLSDPMRVRMDQYGAVVKRLAESTGAIFVDVQAAFDRACQHRHPMYFAWDRIHPNLAGITVISRAFLNATGFDWNA